jgi:hypothetical protein
MTFLNLLARGRGLGWAMSFAIGVDVGGTMIKAGLLRLSDGELVERLNQGLLLLHERGLGTELRKKYFGIDQ